MKALRQCYTLGVLWLLSVVAQDAADAIYRSGHEDGMTELRDFMRRELTAVQVATAADRLRSYNQGYRDAMRFYGADVPQADAAEQVH